MRIGYFDCFSGASGDMILGALIHAGVDASALRAELAKLNLPDWSLEALAIKKQGFAAIQVEVKRTGQPGHRHLHHITKIISDAALSDPVKKNAIGAFTRLAEAEARVHGTMIEKVHFHEVGAVDAIIDVVGAAIGVELFKLDEVRCSAIPVGSGTVTCEHGVMPVPAPATAELLRGVPIAACDEVGELATPTGAAILTTLAKGYGPLPAMTIGAVGYGAGRRDGKTRPNVLRLLVGETAANSDETDQVVMLETNLDDATGEEIGFACEALFAAGALDVFTTPIQMKKGRPGTLLSVICAPQHVAACEEAMFRHTTTLGIRRYDASRVKLQRESGSVTTEFGVIRVKVASRHGRVVRVSPEYDDCAAAARRANVPLQDVMQAARGKWREGGASK